ncbi:TIGR03086 family protein [Blastococcus sp. TML/M2B]|uniref:TIGR03086 family metal-binding protein n=1 Tax=unclassified Blastococcus TaxID=2619396 RepID=UPI00190BE0DA|nr:MULTISPECIES: TIGR03086 family metal-binding protein [unclassified Blastococcus]MBN1093358.1 TIGR03086 family protein [Blastococcus sp. TML/M2B]MBN1096526.1 TIGR03086 family protein [Blastococcus sp. TML/C7B]
METFDLAPAAAELRRIAAGVDDDQLADPTPCGPTPVAGLLDHLVGLTLAFRMAAEKTVPDGGPHADATKLAADWRTRLPAQLDDLVDAWRKPDAWEGMAIAGGVQMPGAVMAVVALDELVVHGWDLAVATGQGYRPDEESARRCLEFAASFGDDPEARAGLYGPVVPVPAQAPLLDRLLGQTGRDPGWRPRSS